MSKLNIYLDNCCFNRPFDDQSYLSIFLETYAKLAIQDLVNADYFITVDKGILKKRNFIKNLKIVNPIDFITILEGRDDTN
jgi:predicted nucleic acid-binding protein